MGTLLADGLLVRYACSFSPAAARRPAQTLAPLSSPAMNVFSSAQALRAAQPQALALVSIHKRQTRRKHQEAAGKNEQRNLLQSTIVGNAGERVSAVEQKVPSTAIDSTETSKAIKKDEKEPQSSFNVQSEPPKRELRSSRVPTTRFGRFMQYGGLAAQLGMGAVGEAVRRAGGSKPLIEGASPLLSEANITRLVAKLSQMRGAALKLGQLISIQDSDVLPKQVEEVLARVQNGANYMPESQMKEAFVKELGPKWQSNFSSFNEKPFAAASIGQVHDAILSPTLSAYPKDFRVAVKLQYPGIAQSIDSDLSNLRSLVMMAGVLPTGLYLDNAIQVARRELHWETDYIREAECMRRFRHLILTGQQEIVNPEEAAKIDKMTMEGDFVVPRVVDELSTKKALVMEYQTGIPLGEVAKMEESVRNSVAEKLLRLCLRELMEFRYMQTDPNWSNFLYSTSTNQIKLLDFGSTRSFSREFMDTYIRVLVCASKQDRQGVLQWSEKLGLLTGFETELMKEAHVTAVLTLGEPFLHDTYDFAQSRSVMLKVRSLIPTLLEHRLSPPPDETYSIHRKLSGVFLLCARLQAKVRCRDLFYEVMEQSGRVI